MESRTQRRATSVHLVPPLINFMSYSSIAPCTHQVPEVKTMHNSINLKIKTLQDPMVSSGSEEEEEEENEIQTQAFSLNLSFGLRSLLVVFHRMTTIRPTITLQNRISSLTISTAPTSPC